MAYIRRGCAPSRVLSFTSPVILSRRPSPICHAPLILASDPAHAVRYYKYQPQRAN